MRWNIFIVVLALLILVCGGAVSALTATISPIHDGGFSDDAASLTWSNLIAVTTSDSVWNNNTGYNDLEFDAGTTTNTFINLRRHVITFRNMSTELGDGATITGGYLTWVGSGGDNLFTGFNNQVVLVGGTPTNPITLVKGDYGSFTTTALSNANTSSSANPYTHTMVLNAAGLSMLGTPNNGIYNTFYLIYEDDRNGSFSGTWGSGQYAYTFVKGINGVSSVRPSLTVTYTSVQPPVASFTKDKTSGANPLTVTFTDTSTNTPTSWYWVFGDGATSTTQSPSHQYTSAGTFNANLTATNSAGSNTTSTQSITVGNAPSASFTKDVTTGTIPFYVQFTNTSSGTATLTYYWVFADGSTSTSASPSHQFTTVGSYAVNVTVTNSYGTSQSATQTITSNQISAPTASFTKDKTGGATPCTVQFTDTSTGAPASWYWVFGDGTTSTSASPSHQFTTGTYNVNLTATNAGGSTTSATQAITVVPVPASSFTVANNYGATPYTALFTFTGSGADSYLWNFGDGSTTNNTAQNPIHTFSTSNTFTVHVTATNTYGSSQSSDGTIHTGVKPLETWIWSPTGNKMVGVTRINATETDGSYPPYSYQWNLRAPNTTIFVNYSLTNVCSWIPDVAGDWQVAIRAQNAYGTLVGSYYTVIVINPLTPSFTPSVTSGINPLSVTFTSSNGAGSAATSWYWVFGDGNTSTLQNPTHQYIAAGVYNVNLTTRSSTYTLINTTATQAITVMDPPTNVLWTANVSDSVPQTTTVERFVKFTPTFTGTQTNASYYWEIRGQHNFANGQIWDDETEPVLEIWGGQGAVESGWGWINLTVTTDAGVGTYNHTYNMDGLKPKVNTLIPTLPSGSVYPGSDVGFAISYDSVNGAFPYNISVNYGDGTISNYGDIIPKVHASTLYPYYTAPVHQYATAGVKTITITSTNIWGVETFTQSYTIVAIPATPAATMRWSKQDGTTITSANVGDQVYYTFNTVSDGHNPPYVGQDMDVFYIRLFKLDPSTNSYIEQPQPQGLITQAFGFGSYNTNSPITLTAANINPYYGYDASGMTSTTFSGSNYTGSVPYTPTTTGTYRMYLVGASLDPYVTTHEYYTYGYKDLTVSGKLLDVAATGDWATNFGGEAFKMVIAVIVMIAAIGVPFAITREFNLYVETVAAVLGIGACYAAGLVPIWVIIGMVIIGAVVIFFMSRGGGAGGDTGGEAMG